MRKRALSDSNSVTQIIAPAGSAVTYLHNWTSDYVAANKRSIKYLKLRKQRRVTNSPSSRTSRSRTKLSGLLSRGFLSRHSSPVGSAWSHKTGSPSADIRLFLPFPLPFFRRARISLSTRGFECTAIAKTEAWSGRGHEGTTEKSPVAESRSSLEAGFSSNQITSLR